MPLTGITSGSGQTYTCANFVDAVVELDGHGAEVVRLLLELGDSVVHRVRLRAAAHHRGGVQADRVHQQRQRGESRGEVVLKGSRELCKIYANSALV